MLYKGLMVTALSGKIDGLIASHNRGGAYFKQHVIPVDPNTPRQQLMREALAAATGTWQSFTPDDRTAWELFARTFRVRNRIGDERRLSSWNCFCAKYLLRYQVQQTFWEPLALNYYAPTSNARDFKDYPPSAVVSDANTGLEMRWNSDDGWPENDDDFFVVYISPVQPRTVNFYKGPYFALGIIGKQGASTPVQPIELTFPPGYTIGYQERCFWRLRLSRGNAYIGPNHYGYAEGNV
jgi:hypothetical protein